MDSKKLYIIRHGQTEYNKRGVVQGRGIDAPLNELGVKQAQAFFDKYHKIDFDKIYTSTLKRTHQTVEPFLDRGFQHHQLSGLDEISWGVAEGKAFDTQLNGMYYQLIEDWKNGKTDRKIEEGESPEDVRQRQEEAINTILNGPEKTVLICMHGRAMRILLAWITNVGLSNMDTFEHNNLSLYQLSYHQRNFSIDIHNETSHLSDFIA